MHRKRGRTIVLGLAAVLLMGAGMLCQEKEVYAQEIVTAAEEESGACGDNAVYTLDSDGTLTISGTGKIADHAFENREDIKAVVIEKGITRIGDNAFYDCFSLESVKIAEGVTDIGDSAFCACDELKKIVVPKSVTRIGLTAFFMCSNLKTAGPIGGGYNFEFGWEDKIPDHTFSMCHSLESVVFPKGLKWIGEEAFDSCSKLTCLDIPDGVTYIGIGAFGRCTGLTQVNIPTSLRELSSNIFWLCESLEEVQIPENIKSINGTAFWNCTNLKHVEIPESVETIGDRAFSGCEELERVELPKGLKQIEFGVFENCYSLKSIEIPEGVTEIGGGAFAECSSLKSINIPTKVQTIWSDAFRACTALESIEILGNVERIEEKTFWGCTSLEKVVLSRSVKYIDPYAFEFAPVTFYGARGSYVEQYAQEVDRPFVALAWMEFKDMVPGAWYTNAVKYVYNKGIMTGLTANNFGASDSLARAQFAVILYRMNGSPAVEYAPTFPDVPKGQWYTDAVLWANRNGIVNGYSDSGLFGTSDRINREQMAVMMYRYANGKGYDTSKSADFSSFADASKVNTFAKEAMSWAVGNGIITGKNQGTLLDPQGNASRAECATIIMRFMEKYEAE